MITFSKLGNKGNLGNQLFHIASTIGIAKKHQHDYFFPTWNYASYFENELPNSSKDDTYIPLKEAEFNYHEWNITNSGNYDIDGWLQTEKYFDIEKTKAFFKFKEEFTVNTLAKYNSIFDKKTILISVRRGDFVNNPNFFQLSYRYYLLALINNFPDFEDRTLIFTSDDIDYCKFHYSFLKNAVFLENIPPMEQIVIGMKCDDYIISNSTFSWWIAWLGENENKRIFRPIKNLRGKFGKINNDKDYFPGRWISFDERQYSLPLKYASLMAKGEFYNLISNARFALKTNWIATKKLIKKLIGRK